MLCQQFQFSYPSCVRNFSNFSATLLIVITCFGSLQLTCLSSFSHFVKKHAGNTFYLHRSNYQSVVNMSRRMIHFVIRARVPSTDFSLFFFLFFVIIIIRFLPFSIYSFQNPRFLPNVALSRRTVAQKSLPPGPVRSNPLLFILLGVRSFD